MAVEICVEAIKGTAPIVGSLTGSFEDCLSYLRWSMNVFASKGDLNSELKGKAFRNAVQTLNDRFNVSVTTHYLKQFCEAERQNLHIAYMMRLGEFLTEPIKTQNRKRVMLGAISLSPRVVDKLITKEEADKRNASLMVFQQQAISEFDAFKIAHAQQNNGN